MPATTYFFGPRCETVARALCSPIRVSYPSLSSVTPSFIAEFVPVERIDATFCVSGSFADLDMTGGGANRARERNLSALSGNPEARSLVHINQWCPAKDVGFCIK